MKGFIFTTDALLAILVAMTIASMAAITFQVTEGGDNYISTYDANTTDAAMVGLYQNLEPSDFGLLGNIDTTKKYSICTTQYQYNPSNNQEKGRSYNPKDDDDFFQSQFWIEKKFCGASP